MVKYAGKDVAISVNTVSTTYVALGGLKTKSAKISAGGINVTDSDSAGRWREMLDGVSSEISMSVTAAGHFVDDTGIETVRAAQIAGTLKSFKVLFPGLGTYEGLFKITELNLDGAHDGAVEQSISLESAGAITFTTAP